MRHLAVLLCMALPALLGGCALWRDEGRPAPGVPVERRLEPPREPPIVQVPAWGGQPLATPAKPQRITRITVHHQGEVWPSAQRPDDDPVAYLRRLQGWSRQSRQWIDIPYHYVIAPDGRIYATRELAAPGDTNTGYDPTGHALLMLMGNFEVQEPTAAQRHSAVALMRWLAHRHGLGADTIASHRDYTTQTVCPGRNLYAQLPALREAVRQGLPPQPAPAGRPHP